MYTSQLHTARDKARLVQHGIQIFSVQGTGGDLTGAIGSMNLEHDQMTVKKRNI